MKNNFLLRSFAALFIMVCLLTAPLTASAAAMRKKGEKNFKQGLIYETAQQWDKAAEEFALSIAAKPGDAEYILHYRRALFNASQMMMSRGRVFSEQKNYAAAYNAFRQAYGYDPVNELAKSEMDRMLRLQNDEEDPNDPNKPKSSPSVTPPAVKLIPTSYTPNNGQASAVPQQDIPQQLEPLRDIKYTKVDLKNVIKDLAQSLDLNVLFDKETPNFRSGSNSDLTIELKNVTTAQALDAIFLQEGLFFQKVGKRMILVASQQRRQNFQQLVLRTFYLANAKPADVQKVLQSAIPPQPGRPPSTIIVDDATNSITVRDTSENIKTIASLIRAVDKDRAEVVMDVNIYEVSKSDLLQIGNQIGDSNSLVNLGGFDFLNNRVSGSDIIKSPLKAVSAGILLPAANLRAFQQKDDTKLLASTQVHAFNNEESQARIGERVPVQTAQLLGVNNGNNGNNGNGGVFNNNGVNAASVINYEQTGLTLKFTPTVFPNQDVQVKMSIESKSINGEASTTPIFTERSISGTARIQNNRTLMLASVAQDNQSNGRAGLPVVGLIPILGRLFTAPKKNNRQVDIVIAVTPRVLRAPAILPGDEVERETGSIAVPTSSSLADMIRLEDREDQIAAARRVPNVAVVQLPDRKPEEAQAPGYVPANAVNNQTAIPAVAAAAVAAQPNAPAVLPQPIDVSAVKTLTITPTAGNFTETLPPSPIETKITPDIAPAPPTAAPTVATPNSVTTTTPAAAAPSALLKVEPLGFLKAGEKRRVFVMVNSPSALRLAVMSLGFNAGVIKINRICYGSVYGADLADKDVPPFAAGSGVLTATLPTTGSVLAQGAGILAYVDIEALSDGDAALTINNSAVTLIGVNGENLTASVK